LMTRVVHFEEMECLLFPAHQYTRLGQPGSGDRDAVLSTDETHGMPPRAALGFKAHKK
jgi:hypothetical protein